jgi:VanZ family protein
MITPRAIERVSQILFWLALIFAFVMASLPKPPPLPGEPGDKLLHVLAFATLAALIVPAYPRSCPIWLFCALAIFGALIEVVQMIPSLGRQASLDDWIADIAAAGVVLIIARFAYRWALRRYSSGTHAS